MTNARRNVNYTEVGEVTLENNSLLLPIIHCERIKTLVVIFARDVTSVVTISAVSSTRALFLRLAPKEDQLAT